MAVKLKRKMGDIPLGDSRYDCLVQIDPSVVKKAKRGDPTSCAIAEVFKVNFGAEFVEVYVSKSYVEMTDAKGKKKIVRFTHPKATQEFIKAFDQGKAKIPAEGYVLALKAPPKGERLDTKAERDLEKRRAIKAGTYEPKPRKVNHKKPKKVMNLDIRSGQGRIQHSRAQASL